MSSDETGRLRLVGQKAAVEPTYSDTTGTRWESAWLAALRDRTEYLKRISQEPSGGHSTTSSKT